MQRKYIFIHLSVPIRPLPLLPALSYPSVVLPSLHFLKWLRSHPGLLDRHFRGRLCHPVELSDLICRDLLLSCHLIVFFVRLLLSFFSPSDSSTLKFDHSRILVSLGGSLRCMRGAVIAVLFFFIMSKKITVYFPKRFIAIAWCFLSRHCKYTHKCCLKGKKIRYILYVLPLG